MIGCKIGKAICKRLFSCKQVHNDGHVRDAALAALRHAFKNVLRNSGESLPELLGGLFWIPDLLPIMQHVALTFAGFLRPQDMHQAGFVRLP